MYFDNVSETNGLEKNSLGPRGTKRIHYIRKRAQAKSLLGVVSGDFPLLFLELISLANTTARARGERLVFSCHKVT